jgi:Tfp pilus assembly protein PilF
MKKTWLIWTGWFLLLFVLASCATGKDEQGKKEGAAYRRVGEAYMQQGNIAAAMQEFKKAEEKYPDDYLLQYDLGLIYYSRGRFDEAIGHYQKAVGLKADYGPAINSLGNAYAGKKDWDRYPLRHPSFYICRSGQCLLLQRGTGAFRKILS